MREDGSQNKICRGIIFKADLLFNAFGPHDISFSFRPSSDQLCYPEACPRAMQTSVPRETRDEICQTLAAVMNNQKQIWKPILFKRDRLLIRASNCVPSS